MKKTHGFTLLEMSIVLVIIALIVAGVVSGKTIIRQAELRAVLQEYDRYSKATKEFQDKYLQLPGDFSGAEAAWGVDSDGGANPCPNNVWPAPTTTSTATCSGNGDGRVDICSYDMTAVACTTTYIDEVWRVWQHLANAGLIDGRYTGRRGGTVSSTQASPGLNVPASRLRPAGWTFLFYIDTRGFAGLSGDHYGHVFLFGGGKGGHSGVFTTEPVVPVKDAIDLDVKIDDGLPTTGILRAWDDYWLPSSDNGPTAGVAPSYCVNVTAYFVPDGTYNDKEYMCSLIFIPGL
jgi:prepilin-type N-terminal cleavage/methylation domain-containing protein